MKKISLFATCFGLAAVWLGAEEPSTLEKAAELGEATKNGAAKAYDKTIEVTKRAASATKEKAVEAGAVVKEKSGQADEASKEAASKAADKTAEFAKETARAATEKASDLLTTKKELELYDTNKDGRLDDAERAKMNAAQKAAKSPH